MNGYGQLNYNDSLINALAQQRALEQQQNAIQQGMAGNNGWTGGAGILGQALLGLAAGKKAKQQQSLDAEIQKQIAQMQAGAEQQARDLEAKKSQGMYETALGILGNEQQARAVQQGLAKISDFQKSPEQTTLVRNAIAAGYDPATPQGQEFIRNQMMKSNAPSVNVDLGKNQDYQVGKIPDGYALIRNAQGQPEYVKIAGSPQLQEEKEGALLNQRKIEDSFATFNNMNDVINETKGQIGGASAGFGGQVLSGIGGTGAADLESNLATIQADAAFSELQKMRDNSKTGGALGQVSERELTLLASAKAALQQKQSPEQLRRNIERYQKVRQGAMDRVAEAYKADYGQYPRGYKPTEQSQNQQSKTALSNMSDDDLMRAIQNAN